MRNDFESKYGSKKNYPVITILWNVLCYQTANYVLLFLPNTEGWTENMFPILLMRNLQIGENANFCFLAASHTAGHPISD